MFRISQETKEILRESTETVGREVKPLTLPSSEALSLALDAFALGFIFSTRRDYRSLTLCFLAFLLFVSSVTSVTAHPVVRVS